MSRTVIKLLSALSAAAVLAACSSSTDDPAKDPSKSRSLAVGDTAHVKMEALVDGRTVTGDVDLTIDAVKMGTPKDFEALKDPSKYEGKTPWYVQYTQELTSDVEVGERSIAVSAELADGKQAQSLIVLTSDIGACAEQPWTRPEPFTLEKGQKMYRCATFLTSADQELASVGGKEVTPEARWKVKAGSASS